MGFRFTFYCGIVAALRSARRLSGVSVKIFEQAEERVHASG